MSPSYHHAYVCSKLIAALNKVEAYSVFSELSLQLGAKDCIPDVALYPKRTVEFTDEDPISMTEMPLMVVEVLSPSQPAKDALTKFRDYFAAGVKSCWLIIPISKTVLVYSAPNAAQTFHAGDVIDTVTNIRVPVNEIFS